MNDSGFRAALRSAGLNYAGPLVPDGKLHRFKASDDREPNSWYVLHAGQPAAGAFGCWKRGLSETWCERGERQCSQAEWKIIRGRWLEAERQREAEEQTRQARAKMQAESILKRSKLVAAHAYLTAKGAKPFGELRVSGGKLVLPLRDIREELHSVQFIHSDGSKHFLEGGRIAGCFFALADRADGPLIICEGYATGASIQEATGLATVCALNCGNLSAVAGAMRKKYPSREIIVAADNDAWTASNPGLSKGTEAAKASKARLAIPQFPDVSDQPTDFNDLARLEGRAEVRRQIEAATTPAETDEELLTRLAALPPLDYERQRKPAADRLGISRLSALDAEVSLRRPQAPANGQGSIVDLPDVSPWPESVDGAEVLSRVSETFSRYLALPPGAADTLALWTAHTHCFSAFELSNHVHETSVAMRRNTKNQYELGYVLGGLDSISIGMERATSKNFHPPEPDTK